MVTVRVAVPVPPALRVTFVGLILAVNPDEEVEVVKVTLPLNPFRLASVMVDVADELSWTKRGDGFGKAENPTILVLPINVDQQENGQFGAPCATELYSPATQTRFVSVGSTPAPK